MVKFKSVHFEQLGAFIPPDELTPTFYSKLEELHFSDCKEISDDLLMLVRDNSNLRTLKIDLLESECRGFEWLLCAMGENSPIENVSLSVSIWSRVFAYYSGFLDQANVRDLELRVSCTCIENQTAEVFAMIGRSGVLEKLTVKGFIYSSSVRPLCENLSRNESVQELTLDF